MWFGLILWVLMMDMSDPVSIMNVHFESDSVKSKYT